MNNKWKRILGVAGIFLLGLLAGGFLVAGMAAKRLHRIAHDEPAFTAQEITRAVTRRVQLDATQRAQFEAIVEETQKRLLAARKEAEPQNRAIIEAGITRARALLHPGQQAAFDQLILARRAKLMPQAQ